MAANCIYFKNFFLLTMLMKACGYQSERLVKIIKTGVILFFVHSHKFTFTLSHPAIIFCVCHIFHEWDCLCCHCGVYGSDVSSLVCTIAFFLCNTSCCQLILNLSAAVVIVNERDCVNACVACACDYVSLWLRQSGAHRDHDTSPSCTCVKAS